MFDFSPVQIILVLAIALLVLGPKRLPGMAKSLGHGLRGFRDSLAGADEPDGHVDGPVVAAEGEVQEQELSARLQPVEPADGPEDEQEAATGLQAVEPIRTAG